MNNSKQRITALRLRQCRQQARETLDHVAEQMGVNKTTVMRWEQGSTAKVNLSTLQNLARHYGVTAAWLAGETDDPTREIEKMVYRDTASKGWVDLPILGSVRAGMGGIVQEEIIGYEAVQTDTLLQGECYFWLRVTGDSMAPLIQENDLVLVRKQSSVDSGRYAVVMIDGEEGLIKKVVYDAEWIELHSINPRYPVRRFEYEEVLQVQVIGVVIESKRKF